MLSVREKMCSQLAIWQWAAFLVFVLDQTSKACAQWVLDVNDTLPVVKGFNLVLAFNSGAAFSFLADASGWQRGFLIGFALVMLCGILIWLRTLLRDPQASCIEGLSLALIFGGALGNLMDRTLTGKVVDFIQLYYQDWYWPAFNIADTAICVGTAGLVWVLCRKEKLS